MPGNAVDRLAAKISQIAGADVELERPNDPAHGDYATNVALRTAPAHKRSPRELADELAQRVVDLPEVERADVAGPGFLNLWVARDWFVEALEELDADYGGGFAQPPHEEEYYFNDTGRQVDLFRESVGARRRGEAPPEGGYVGEYLEEIAALDRDPVEAMLEEIRREIAEFRISIDSWRRQAEIEAEVAELLPRLDTYEAEGTVWARTSTYGDDKDRPLVRSADGSYLYFAADIAYVRDKLERGFDRAIYVLGADHHGYVARLKAAAAMLGYDPDRIEVLIYQLVHIVERGEARKGSKRRGDVVFLRELLEKIGIDAARWYLVSRSADQPIDIDVDLAREQTQKNPVYYVQYAHARIAGIIRNADKQPAASAAPAALDPLERELLKRLTDFPTIVAEATERRAPHALPIYAIRVADDFHRFYHDLRVIGSDEEAFRLALCGATQKVIARCLDLIGVEAPERM
ncbi:MAG: arginine--tRNA ligase [Actinobacteria bacterium]|nr:MAG: arginine--tRNA ligase [Actinomycetota bacterium]